MASTFLFKYGLICIYLLQRYSLSQEISLGTCSVAQAGQSCRLTCSTHGLSNDIHFYKDDFSVAQCFRLGQYKSCKTFSERYVISQNVEKNETNLSIPNVNLNNDQGIWYCSHRTVKGSKKEMKIYEYDESQTTTEQKEPREVVNATIHTEVDVFTCLYPEPKVACLCNVEKKNITIQCVSEETTMISSDRCKGGRKQMYRTSLTLPEDCTSQEDATYQVTIMITNKTIDTIDYKILIPTATTVGTLVNEGEDNPSFMQKDNSMADVIPKKHVMSGSQRQSVGAVLTTFAVMLTSNRPYSFR